MIQMRYMCIRGHEQRRESKGSGVMNLADVTLRLARREQCCIPCFNDIEIPRLKCTDSGGGEEKSLSDG